MTVEGQLHFASESVEAGELVELEVVAWNRSEEPVSQMVAELSSVDRVFDGVQIPLGWMDPGEEVRSRILVQLPAGRTGRDSHVELLLRDSEKRQVSAETWRFSESLSSSSTWLSRPVRPAGSCTRIRDRTSSPGSIQPRGI